MYCAAFDILRGRLDCAASDVLFLFFVMSKRANARMARRTICYNMCSKLAFIYFFGRSYGHLKIASLIGDFIWSQIVCSHTDYLPTLTDLTWSSPPKNRFRRYQRLYLDQSLLMITRTSGSMYFFRYCNNIFHMRTAYCYL